MPITTSTLLLLTIAGVSALILLVYFYSNELSIPQTIQLPNGTKITTSPEKITQATNLGFIHAFIASISVIVVSEIGDKTFFIAAILAMRHSRLIIYSGAMAALGAMTILSALLGNVVTKFVPRIYTYYVSSLLFACFGIKMLRDGYMMSPDEGSDEYEEVQHEVEKAEVNEDLELGGGGGGTSNSSSGNPSGGQQQRSQSVSKQRTTLSKFTMILRRYVSPIFIQAFIMTFLAVRRISDLFFHVLDVHRFSRNGVIVLKSQQLFLRQVKISSV